MAYRKSASWVARSGGNAINGERKRKDKEKVSVNNGQPATHANAKHLDQNNTSPVSLPILKCSYSTVQTPTDRKLVRRLQRKLPALFYPGQPKDPPSTDNSICRDKYCSSVCFIIKKQKKTPLGDHIFCC